ncbi:hypothetical protein C1H70_03720 [Halomonas urumqiensis]|uniref:Uncharacterized protein n=1 Tax=Halomonas urumqiensis TaxID=1684789 RepID=A0A2N7UN38_9GAMM|nr:hypothetical protein C1H70_03720 [Halomonas urumqiensis]
MEIIDWLVFMISHSLVRIGMVAAGRPRPQMQGLSHRCARRMLAARYAPGEPGALVVIAGE